MRGRRSRRNEMPKKPSHMINEAIRAPKIRLIGPMGENVGIVSRSEALMAARDAGLDLVQIGQFDEGVIAKIMDHGKYLYEKKKQDNKNKKNQKIVQIKELKFRPNIGTQDYMVKIKRAEQFLTEGKRVKFTLQFRRGREAALIHTAGPALFARIHADLETLELGNLLEEKEQRGRLLWSKMYYLKAK